MRFGAYISAVCCVLLCAASYAGNGSVVRIKPAISRIVPSNAGVVKLAEGFGFTEGPVWHPDGYLLFSDIPGNAVYRYKPGEGTSLYLQHSGTAGSQETTRTQGSNGLAVDPQGHLVLCQHGARQVVRQIDSATFRPIARQYRGQRLNSPNDLVIRSDGLIYFTDPPWGLDGKEEDPAVELPFQALFLLRNNDLILLDSDLARPNGLTLSPEEDRLYVSNLDGTKKEYFVYDVLPDGSVENRRLFFDATDLPGSGSPDGIKADKKGNLYCTGPGGVLVITPRGQHIGTIVPAEQPSNLAWGGADGRTLYMTCRTGLYAIDLKIKGVRNWMP
jgi:gluconolactonase